MTKEYYELRENRINMGDLSNIRRGLAISIKKAKEMENKALNKGNAEEVELFKEVRKSIEKTLHWFNSNLDSYPSMELLEEADVEEEKKKEKLF